MTCNVGNGRARPERLIPMIRDSGADLIGIQELSDDQAEAITNQLAEDYLTKQCTQVGLLARLCSVAFRF